MVRNVMWRLGSGNWLGGRVSGGSSRSGDVEVVVDGQSSGN